MKIYIPTLGRVKSQDTWDFMPPSLRKDTFLVCPPSETGQHISLGRNVLSCPVNGVGTIGQVRQWIIDQHSGEDKLVMLDDDHRYYKRLPESVSLRYASPEQIEELFSWIEQSLDNYTHVGVSVRQGNNTVKEKEAKNCRMFGVLGVRPSVLAAVGARYDNLPVMEDFDVILTLLRSGHQNIVNYEFCWGQKTSNAPGGCSTYRNNLVQENAAKLLAEKHHPFVKLVEKKSKSGWSGMQTRVDVTIYWKKAHASSL